MTTEDKKKGGRPTKSTSPSKVKPQRLVSIRMNF